jgi:hypothetical protein
MVARPAPAAAPAPPDTAVQALEMTLAGAILIPGTSPARRIHSGRESFGGGYGSHPDGQITPGTSEVLRLVACNIPRLGGLGGLYGTQKLLLSLADPQRDGQAPWPIIRDAYIRSTGLYFDDFPSSKSLLNPPELITVRTGAIPNTGSVSRMISGFVQVLTSADESDDDLTRRYLEAFRGLNVVESSPAGHTPSNVLHIGVSLTPATHRPMILVLEVWSRWTDYGNQIAPLLPAIDGLTSAVTPVRIIDVATVPGYSWVQPNA